jgi:hypothetical protein
VCSCFSVAYTQVKTEPCRAQGVQHSVLLDTFSHLNATASKNDAHSYLEVFSMLASARSILNYEPVYMCVRMRSHNMGVADHLRHCQRL